jgi:CRISPR-associated protein Cmr6
MYFVVPKDTVELHGDNLEKVEYYSNFSLLFRNYVPWRKMPDLKFPPGKWSNFESFQFDDVALFSLHERGTQILQRISQFGYPTCEFSMRTTWRLITGIGASSSLETGMILHHVYGFPYIPGSSLKGLLRYYMEEVIEEDQQKIMDILGFSAKKNASKGKIVFLDAFPKPGFRISVDIMNNHYQNYYMENDPPGDWMDPVPVKFLTVTDAEFVFRLFASDCSIDSSVLDEVAASLSKALIELGIGAKTAVGYGRFVKTEHPSSLTSEIPEEKESDIIGTSPGSESFHFYDEPDGTKEYYLNRIDMAEPYSEEIQWLFQKWERDESWSKDTEIAKAFLRKVKKTKKSGKETHFYKVIKSILGEIG